jgi:hypothetical protein
MLNETFHVITRLMYPRVAGLEGEGIVKANYLQLMLLFHFQYCASKGTSVKHVYT